MATSMGLWPVTGNRPISSSNGTETRGWQATLDRYRARYQAEGKQMGTLDFPQLDLLMLGTEAALTRARWRLQMPDG